MTLGVLLIIPLPLDGEWTWESSVGSPLLGFLVGIPVFILGLWTLTFGLRSGSEKSLTGSVPLIDEWIGEQGNEEEERAESQRLLLTDEKLEVSGRAWAAWSKSSCGHQQTCGSILSRQCSKRDFVRIWRSR
jgi:hypothetical protein